MWIVFHFLSNIGNIDSAEIGRSEIFLTPLQKPKHLAASFDTLKSWSSQRRSDRIDSPEHQEPPILQFSYQPYKRFGQDRRSVCAITDSIGFCVKFHSICTLPLHNFYQIWVECIIHTVPAHANAIKVRMSIITLWRTKTAVICKRIYGICG